MAWRLSTELSVTAQCVGRQHYYGYISSDRIGDPT